MKHFLTILYISFFILSASFNAEAGERPVWWDQVFREAQRDGYGLVTMDELKKLYESNTKFLTVDTRTDYEFRDGHLPDAVNLEFDPGDKLQFKSEKRAAFLKLLGPDENRKIIIYCRNFR